MFLEILVYLLLYMPIFKIKKQMNYANNLNYKFVVICGENEIKSKMVTLKNMITGNQITDKVEKNNKANIK